MIWFEIATENLNLFHAKKAKAKPTNCSTLKNQSINRKVTAISNGGFFQKATETGKGPFKKGSNDHKSRAWSVAHLQTVIPISY